MEILKGKSVWEIKPRPSDSWLWKKLLEVRSSYNDSVKKVIGDGTTSSFWYDPCHTWGISDTAGPNLRRKLHITDNARVSSILVNMNGGFHLEGIGMKRLGGSVLTALRLGENVEKMNGLGSQVPDSR